MERVFEEISDPFWASATSAAGGGLGPRMMGRSPSEWMLEKFLECGDAVPEAPPLPPPPPTRNQNPNPSFPVASVSSSNFSSDEVVEIKNSRSAPPPPPPVAAQIAPADPAPDVDPGEYAAMLKQKLDMYCHAVALARVLFFNFEHDHLSFLYLLLLVINN
ncbi:light-inducible protein CPRF2-like [Iris pallida]|uniref:Light-inducible protein CPRF2-like n=1 Tax=Iris pallida TaxID=29817 RepID=A0AAX6EVQ4_IRIPA|nr:light-inducible protein CPRF2-like [Iris pallida]